MFVIVVLLLLMCQTNCDTVRYRCGKSGDTPVKFTPAADGVTGRYTLELCTLKNPKVTNWFVELWYYKNLTNCEKGTKPNFTHSISKEPIENYKNCTNVCYSMDFDIIFAGCYNIHSDFARMDGTLLRMIHDSKIVKSVTVENNLTLEWYKQNRAYIAYSLHKDDFTLHWYLGLPVTFYEVSLEFRIGNTEEYLDDRLNITQSCTKVKWNEVLCTLTEPEGCYRATFQHIAPWSSILSDQTYYSFCRSAVVSPVVRGASAGGAAWWAAGALLMAGAAGAALLLYRALSARHYHKRKHVLDAWTHRRECEAPPVDIPTGGRILLLYAREGAHGEKAIAALKNLLEDVTGEQVLDLYDSTLMAAAAPAQATWVRGAVLAHDSRVVLVQSPALAACRAELRRTDLRLSEPLLGRRVLYRAPQPADQLLVLALRLLAESVAAHRLYRRYYVASFGALSPDVVPQLVPYRRYELPAAAAALARDLARDQASDLARDQALDLARDVARDLALDLPQDQPTDAAHPHRLDELLRLVTDAAEAFIAHATQNPTYLVDELIFM